MSFYVALHTGTNYDKDAYETAAGNLLTLLSSIIGDSSSLASLTHDVTLTSAKCELDVLMEEGELVARAVIDLEADEKVKFDKSKLTKMIRAHPLASQWPTLRIEKKAVTC